MNSLIFSWQVRRFRTETRAYWETSVPLIMLCVGKDAVCAETGSALTSPARPPLVVGLRVCRCHVAYFIYKVNIIILPAIF